MNKEKAIEIIKTFLIENYNHMNEGPCWAPDPEDCFEDEYTFQEILVYDFDGNLEDCLDLFFRKTMLNIRWFGNWLDEKKYYTNFDDPRNDYLFVCNTFYTYLNECSVDDLKEVLGLEFILK